MGNGRERKKKGGGEGRRVVKGKPKRAKKGPGGVRRKHTVKRLDLLVSGSLQNI